MLKYRADLRSLAFIAAFFGLLAAAYSLPLTWWTGPFLVVALSLDSFFCAVITHNTIHVPMFRNRSLNRLTQFALTLTYGHPVSSYVPGHNLSHHRFTQTPRDLMRTNKLRFRWNLLNQLFFSFVVGPAIFKANLDYAKAVKERRPGWYRQLMLEWTVYIVFLVGLLVLDWQKFLLFVVIPHQYAAWGIMGINFVQHDGCDGESPYNHSRNFTGHLVNWFTFNNGFHGIHHMKPTLHWSLLREAHNRELKPHIHPALDQNYLLPYLWKAYIYPGQRVRYDGSEYILGPEVPDQPWIGVKSNPADEDQHLGAMA